MYVREILAIDVNRLVAIPGRCKTDFNTVVFLVVRNSISERALSTYGFCTLATTVPSRESKSRAETNRRDNVTLLSSRVQNVNPHTLKDPFGFTFAHFISPISGKKMGGGGGGWLSNGVSWTCKTLERGI